MSYSARSVKKLHHAEIFLIIRQNTGKAYKARLFSYTCKHALIPVFWRMEEVLAEMLLGNEYQES
jgi:hypothetical protein